MNSGLKRRRAASRPACGEFIRQAAGAGRLTRRVAHGKTQARLHERAHLARPQIAGHEDETPREIHAAIVAQGQNGLVEDAQHEVPQGVAGLLDFIEQHQGELHFVGVMLVQHVLAERRMGLAVAQVAGRRADQLGDLVAVLELGAIDLHHRARIAHQAFRGGFHNARFPRSGWTEKQKTGHRFARRAHPRRPGLVRIHHLPNCHFLPYHPLAQVALEHLGVPPFPGRIEQNPWPCHRSAPPC